MTIGMFLMLLFTPPYSPVLETASHFDFFSFLSRCLMVLLRLQAAQGQKGSFDAGEHPMAISARNAQAAAAAAEAAMSKGGDTTEAQAYQVNFR